MAKPTRDVWSLEMNREVTQWNSEFTENWTYKYNESDVRYKLRVVGPNGEACREERMSKEDVPRDVRAAFEDQFAEAKEKA